MLDEKGAGGRSAPAFILYFFLNSAEFVKSPHLLFLHSQASHRKSSGFSAVSQLFSERWPSTPAGRSFSGATTERNIDFELDVRVEIDSGKCVLHPTTQQAEHEDISLRRYHRRHIPRSHNYSRERSILFQV